jgi:hypothetical protein
MPKYNGGKVIMYKDGTNSEGETVNLVLVLPTDESRVEVYLKDTDELVCTFTIVELFKAMGPEMAKKVAQDYFAQLN